MSNNSFVYKQINLKMGGDKFSLYCRMPTSKCVKNDPIRKRPFDKYHSNNTFRQDTSMGAKISGESGMSNGMSMILINYK